MQVLTRAHGRDISTVRLVGKNENEIVSFFDALSRAEDGGLDLVLVSDKSTPPVVRIQDYKKIQYEQKKAKQKHSKSSELKEIQVRVNISDHDLATKVNAMAKFLKRGDKVKVVVRLKGRERENPQRGKDLIDRMGSQVEAKQISLPGQLTMAIFEPLKSP